MFGHGSCHATSYTRIIPGTPPSPPQVKSNGLIACLQQAQLDLQEHGKLKAPAARLNSGPNSGNQYQTIS